MLPFDPVDGITCGFENIVPADLSHDFSVLAGGPAGADLVLMSINDSYGPPYSPAAGLAAYSPNIYDADEGHH
ncbi:MAG: hypothetical protein KatS3mg078_1523 [Deltaproteobacteria bacterium]|nr:MAG: hypothetical protein KatS3mg078_1523 [Deltaproteobacteria bacterium]